MKRTRIPARPRAASAGIAAILAASLVPIPAAADTPAAFADLGGGTRAATASAGRAPLSVSVAGDAEGGAAAYASDETSLSVTASYADAKPGEALSASFRLKVLAAPETPNALSYVDGSGTVREVPLESDGAAFKPVPVEVSSAGELPEGAEAVRVSNALYEVSFAGEPEGAERRTFAIDSSGRLREVERAADGAIALPSPASFAEDFGEPASATLSYAPGSTEFTRASAADAWEKAPAKPVAATALFAPASAAGEVSARLSFDAAGYEGATVGADFALSSPSETSTAESARDAGVAVLPPKIEVSGMVATEGGVRARVSLSNLDPSATYTLKGALADAKGAPIEGAASSDVSDAKEEPGAIASFKPAAGSSEQVVDFSLDDEGVSLLADSPAGVSSSFSLESGKGAVSLARGSLDEPATLELTDGPALPSPSSPSVSVKLADATDGDAEALPSKKTSLALTASYSGLQAGRSYVLSAKLVDADSGDLLDPALGTVAATVDFTPTSGAGEVEATFAFDSTRLSGKKVRAIARVALDGEAVAQSQGAGSEVAIDDAIDMTSAADGSAPASSPQGGSLGKTGDDALAAVPAACGVLCASGAAIAVAAKNRSRARRAESKED